jgi:AcrR family transcriptional regulator
VSTSGKGAYHHGDLRAALVAAATQMLEAGETFSLRAVARRAGVSATAPYRHFADREALESAVAVEGFKDLQAALTGLNGQPGSTEDVIALAIAYVHFALQRPAMFRLMFGQECDDENDERVLASGRLHLFLSEVIAGVFPASDPPALSAALWSLAHGLAFLHLDGKFSRASAEEIEARVRASFQAVFALQSEPGQKR